MHFFLGALRVKWNISDDELECFILVDDTLTADESKHIDDKEWPDQGL